MTQPLMDEDDAPVDDASLDPAAPEATEDERSAPDADTPPDDATGQPTTAETPDAGVPSAPPPSSAPAPSPFVVKAHGKALTLDGVQRTPGAGMSVAESAMPRVQQLITRGLEMETFGRTKIRELELQTQELQHSQTEAEVHANAIIEWFEQVATSEEAMAQALVNWATEKPKLDARVERAKWEAEKRQWDRRQRAQEPTPQERYAEVVEGVRNLGQEVLAELAPQHGLSDGEVKAIAARLLRKPDVYLTEIAGPQGPQLAFDDTAFAADVAEEAQLRTQSRTMVTATQKAADANAKQRAGTIPAAVKAPPAPATPQPRDRANGQFTSREEWEAAMRGE